MSIREKYLSLNAVMEEAISQLEEDAENPEFRKSVGDVVDLYKRVKDASDAIEEFSKRARKKRDLLKNVVLPSMFETEDTTSITRGGYRFTVSYNLRAGIKPNEAGKEPAFQWLRDHGYGDIVIETVNASTLSATAKAMADEGEELDDELFSTYIAPTTSVTKAKS